MNTYKRVMNGYKLPQPLTKDEIHKLIQEVGEGSQEARDKLMIHNIRLVLYEVSNKFYNVDYDKEDLVSIGNIGLIKAINKYDISKGFEFTTFAVKCIDSEILQFLRKLKKDQNVDSMNSIIFHAKDGSEIKLEDKLSDDSDLVEDYENSETHEIIRELVKQLPDRDKEIVMLHFGFYNDRIYTQQEIADKFLISQSQVSRIITRIVKELSKQLETVGTIELRMKSKVKENSEKKMRRLQSIYEFFKDYTREQVDEMLSKLTDEERALIALRYGEDLDNPVSTGLSKEQSYKYYYSLVPKMRRLLKNPNNDKTSKLQTIYQFLNDYTREQVDEMLSKLTDEERALIALRYGEDLDNPVPTKLTKEQSYKFYGLLAPKMRRLLANPYAKRKRRSGKPKMNNSPQSSIEPKTVDGQVQEQPILPSEETLPLTPVQTIKEEVQGELIPKTAPKEETSKDITKDDCVRMLELLRTPTFTQMMSVLTTKESIIISLKLGYVDGKYFSTKSIAQFLQIEEEEVRETTKKVLLLYKDSVNSFLDKIIEVATDEHKRKVLSTDQPPKNNKNVNNP